MNNAILSTLFVGIDVDSTYNVVHMMNFNQKDLNHFKVKNDLNGVTDIKDKTIETIKKNDFNNIIIVLESTSIYAFHTATFLSSNEELLISHSLINYSCLHLYPVSSWTYILFIG